MELNRKQQAAVDHGDSPLLILAGAGTGKTKTLAARVGRLLSDGVEPERLCLLTFSRRAAQEMLRRAGSVADPALASRVIGGTFHAVANRLLRHHGRRIGVLPAFTVLDENDACELMGLVRHDLGVTGSGRRRFPRAETLLAIYSRMVNQQEKLVTVLDEAFPAYVGETERIKEVFSSYTTRKREQGTFDFDDLILYWRELTRSSGDSRRRPFDYVLVDEFQDVNNLQSDIVAALAPDGRGVTVVGDDAQAIYGFRGATVANILEFEARFRGTTVVTLEQNYRSINPILTVANAVLANTTSGFRKELWSQREGVRRPVVRVCLDQAAEAVATCDSILLHREDGVTLQNQAVLFRAAHHSSHLELELNRRGVPYKKFGGLRFLEAAHIKDLLAILRVLDNPFDELAWMRTLRLLETVGSSRAAKVMERIGVRQTAQSAGSVHGEETPLTRFLTKPPLVAGVDSDELGLLRDALADCADTSAGQHAPPAAVQVGRLRRFLEPSVRRQYDHPDPRLTDLEQLEHAAANFASRRQFLTDLVLDPPGSTSDLAGPPLIDDEFVTLSTIHSAKGGEWDVVMIIGAADGMIPSDMALRDEAGLEEERRLFYVAVTRARNALEISYPTRFYMRPNGLDDNFGYGQPSRFLSSEVVMLVEREDIGIGLAEDNRVDTGSCETDGASAVSAFLAELMK